MDPDGPETRITELTRARRQITRPDHTKHIKRQSNDSVMRRKNGRGARGARKQE